MSNTTSEEVSRNLEKWRALGIRDYQCVHRQGAIQGTVCVEDGAVRGDALQLEELRPLETRLCGSPDCMVPVDLTIEGVFERLAIAVERVRSAIRNSASDSLRLLRRGEITVVFDDERGIPLAVSRLGLASNDAPRTETSEILDFREGPCERRR